ncbi:hypothetical protein BDY24DRAFT_445382 [Mrakia frigida]|uniref:uncharacterized protein n=1 Tax=Mrakia frigida TaxID=29902 RepID=UPI003FCC061F
MSPSSLPGFSFEGLWDSFMLYVTAFGDYLDKQWWGAYFATAFTIFGAVVVYMAGLKEIGKVQKFHDQVDRHVAGRDANESNASTATSTATAGEGGGGVSKREKVVGVPGSMGSPGSTSGKKRR